MLLSQQLKHDLELATSVSRGQVTMVAFLENYCSWVGRICERRSANARGFPRVIPPPWEGRW